MKAPLFPVLALSAAALITCPAFARGHGHEGDENRPDVIATLDANGDGALDPTELRAADDDLREKLLSFFDANEDGTIDAAEIGEAQCGPGDAGDDLSDFDENGDGTIDESELDDLDPALADELLLEFDEDGDGEIFYTMEFEGGGLDFGAVFEFDTNGDGVIDKDELAAMDPDLAAQYLAAFDVNGNGIIDDVETFFMMEKPGHGHGHHQGHLDKGGLARLDTNGDGAIDESELAALKPKFAAKLLAAFDANGDGSIGAGEIAAAKGMHKNDLGKIDANHDGTLDASELAVLEPAVRDGLLARFDADGDGIITRDEVKAECSEDIGNFERQHAFALAKFDKNNDGRLNTAERSALRAAVLSHKRRVFGKFDLNKNGKLDRTEKAALKAVLKQKKPKRVKL